MFSIIINHPFWGTLIFRNIHIVSFCILGKILWHQGSTGHVDAFSLVWICFWICWVNILNHSYCCLQSTVSSASCWVKGANENALPAIRCAPDQCHGRKKKNNPTPIQTNLSWGLISEAKEWPRYVHDLVLDTCPNSTRLQFQARFRSSPGNEAFRLLLKSHACHGLAMLPTWSRWTSLTFWNNGKGRQCKPMFIHIPKKIAFKF